MFDNIELYFFFTFEIIVNNCLLQMIIQVFNKYCINKV